MRKDLMREIEESLPTFSKGQKMIANYLINNYDKAAYLTAAKLGREVGVSESTVVRFAIELGFDGYPGLQRTLQEIIRNRLTTKQRMEVANTRIGKGDILNNVLESDIDNIRRTMEEIDREAFSTAVQKIIAAKNIYIIGMRSSASLASFLTHYFRLMFDNVRLVQTTSGSEMFEHIFRIGEDDVMIAISFPRYSARLINAVTYAKEQGCNVIAVTDSLQSPIAPYANQILVSRSDMASIVDSFVAPLSVLNALVVAIARQMQPNLNDVFDKLEHIWDEYNAYAKVHEE
ncbi:MAG: MurR/RpiR family transcriptional regulator [Clostridia bacterium]|nr:MurR/RpiR family transcriptional regulator [Clostridia bacterium]